MILPHFGAFAPNPARQDPPGRGQRYFMLGTIQPDGRKFYFTDTPTAGATSGARMPGG